MKSQTALCFLIWSMFISVEAPDKPHKYKILVITDNINYKDTNKLPFYLKWLPNWLSPTPSPNDRKKNEKSAKLLQKLSTNKTFRAITRLVPIFFEKNIVTKHLRPRTTSPPKSYMPYAATIDPKALKQTERFLKLLQRIGDDKIFGPERILNKQQLKEHIRRDMMSYKETYNVKESYSWPSKPFEVYEQLLLSRLFRMNWNGTTDRTRATTAAATASSKTYWRARETSRESHD